MKRDDREFFEGIVFGSLIFLAIFLFVVYVMEKW